MSNTKLSSLIWVNDTPPDPEKLTPVHCSKNNYEIKPLGGLWTSPKTPDKQYASDWVSKLKFDGWHGYCDDPTVWELTLSPDADIFWISDLDELRPLVTPVDIRYEIVSERSDVSQPTSRTEGVIPVKRHEYQSFDSTKQQMIDADTPFRDRWTLDWDHIFKEYSGIGLDPTTLPTWKRIEDERHCKLGTWDVETVLLDSWEISEIVELGTLNIDTGRDVGAKST
jgi:hypothetical protein